MSAYTSGTSPVVPWADSPAPHPATVRLYVLRLSRSRSNNKSIEAFKRNALLPTLLLFSFGAFCIRNAAYVFFFVCYYYTSLSRSLYIYIYIYIYIILSLFSFCVFRILAAPPRTGGLPRCPTRSHPLSAAPPGVRRAVGYRGGLGFCGGSLSLSLPDSLSLILNSLSLSRDLDLSLSLCLSLSQAETHGVETSAELPEFLGDFTPLR